MRRMIITAVALTGLVMPGAAMASHHGRAGHHHRRHHHAHVVRFGTAASTEAASPTGSTSPAPAASPTGDTAGTVASFANGTLTIALNDGSTVGGKVAEGTQIECHSAMASAASDGHGDNGGQGGQGDDNGGEAPSSSRPGDDQQGEVAGQDDGDDEAQQQEGQGCTSAALVPGAVVREAELLFGSAGAVWQKVELNQ
jgi:hypothetical protein